LAHLLLCLCAMVNLFVTPATLFTRLVVFIVLFNLVPVGTVMYRGWMIWHFHVPLKPILLYHLYFLARFYGMCKLTFALDTSSPRARGKQ